MIVAIVVVTLFGCYLAMSFHMDQRLRMKESGKIFLTFCFSVSLYLSHALFYMWLLYLINDGEHHAYFIGFIIIGVMIYERWLSTWGQYVLVVVVGCVRIIFFLCHLPYAVIKITLMVTLRCLTFPFFILIRYAVNKLKQSKVKREELTKDATNGG